MSENKRREAGEVDWRVRHDLLALGCRHHARRAARAEQALADLQSSRLWRLSGWPRATVSQLRDLKRRGLARLMRTAPGLMAYRLWRRLRSRLGQGTAVSKADFRRQSEQRLAAFLASDERLGLPCDPGPKVSIVLVFYHQAALSLDCLRSIIAHCDQPAEVIIVDNASADQTPALLDRLDGAVIIRNDSNRGFVEAVNQAAERARGRHLLLLNNDAELLPGSLSAAVSTLESGLDIGAVGGRIVLLDGRLQEAGSLVWADGSCAGYGRGEDPEAGEFMFRRPVDYCSGAFLLTPLARFRAVGGFDTVFSPAYYEESDYCLRLQDQGWRVIYEPFAVIRHFEFASSGGQSGAVALQQRNRQVFAQRHAKRLAGKPQPGPQSLLEARSQSRRFRLLLIDDRVPHEALGAGYPRCRVLIQQLVDAGFDVTLYPLNQIHDDWRAVYQTLPAEVEVMLGRGIGDLADFVAERANFFDQVVISRPHNMALVRTALGGDLSRFGAAQISYDAEAVIAPREIARLTLLGRRPDNDKGLRMIRQELALADGVDQVIAVSDREAELFRRAGHRRVHVLGHALEPAPTGPAFDQRQGFLFVGALRDDGSPNVDSLLWFVDKVLPRLVEALGDEAMLYVVGEPTAPSLSAIRHDRVQFLGSLDELDLPMSVCRVFIAPTRFAAGIPHKIHAAAAGGLPVVATPLLAEQLGWADGKALLVAGDADSFTGACLRLYQDPAMWARLRQGALAELTRDCAPEAFARQVRAIFRPECASPARSG
ncbi:MAG: glycosyltransferase [Wenzhouxiangella sp.]